MSQSQPGSGRWPMRVNLRRRHGGKGRVDEGLGRRDLPIVVDAMGIARLLDEQAT
ncbi:MAG: hypothetical protein QOH31_146 [Verrucomicrobiota bacterium]|jgi:hypothetical protein